MKEIILHAAEIAKKAYYTTSTNAISNKAPGDLVCETDVQIEEFIKKELSQIYPQASFYGEEGGYSKEQAEHHFIIDPIDGTANYILGIPHFSISVAEIKDNRITNAIIYNPITSECFSANAKGAFLNGDPIHTSDRSRIEDTFVLFGFSANKKGMKHYLKEWKDLMKSCRKALPMMSPSLNICAVACGKSDLFIDNGSSLEGMAAASYILKQAGGVMTKYDGSHFFLDKRKGIIAGNGKITPEQLFKYRRVQ